MADSSLTIAQQEFRKSVRLFAREHLSTARDTYSLATSASQWQERFRSTKPIYQAAVAAGLLKAQIPAPLGGTSAGFVDMALMVEELYSVDTSASLTILGTGLGLTPLIFGGTPELQKKFLAPFLSGEGAPLASLVFSEPWGSANFADDSGEGFRTTAIWATNCSGWDDRGADLHCVVCRIPSSPRGVRSEVALLLVTRDDIAANEPQAYTVIEHPPTLGHTAVNGAHVRFTDLRVPKANLLAPPGAGASIVEATFTGSGALVGAMAVGIMRQTFAAALNWAKTEKRGSNEYMIEKQSVADLLVQIKTRLEASRSLCRRAAAAFPHAKLGAELCYQSKIFCSEAAVASVQDAINLVGVSAYRRDLPFAGLLEDAMVLPIFDGGNVGVRRRQIEALMKQEDYDGLED
ncbi:uncharacterized protein HMPREF1541_03433 [Cyphellophora europaea CBS 101466]|uniref:Acyl-CoA dehydrogenase/oxidase C-terminal domain-containing protein n=1 Tax=Cyphellophora europaea (strain CBS 101466) TaxID=1220924 RepID=W2RYI1_CYPE1|nr:uncharacterized protein HMPREF1541_03433 [Cyphellophora europaea CBS 101466]ETN41497.1 hypothetical protein HMPREF1541_03433 [Cyphellophora europaea CBS 101466]